MALFKNKYRIEPARLVGYDYGSNGAYFITICTQNRRNYFGEISVETHENASPHEISTTHNDASVSKPSETHNDASVSKPIETHNYASVSKPIETHYHASLHETVIGGIAKNFWLQIPQHYPFVQLGEFVVMPNHVHGVIIINKPVPVETHHGASRETNETHVDASRETNETHVDASRETNETHVNASLESNETHVDASRDTNETPMNASLESNETHHGASLQNQFGPQSQNIPAIIRAYKASVKRFANLNNIDFNWQSRYHDRIIRDFNEYCAIEQYIINNPKNWIKDNHFRRDA